jgi:two-component system response regulator HydG
MNGIDILTEVKAIDPTISFIMITGYSDIKIAVKVIKLGAYDYVTKPLLPEEILRTIQKALESKKAEEENEVKEKTNPKNKPAKTSSPYIIGESKQSKELYKQIDLVAPTNYSVIIFGETGTGKESVARMIHDKSSRIDKPFVAMDCGALSNELAGSELFGHEKGSFTGALTSKIGHFELANGGTLFLDEVANLSFEIQTSLLRVVQEQKLKRIGGTKEIDLDVRLIVASNENLFEAVTKGRFREDLYHRFNQFGINLPALRDRGADVMAFAEYFLQIANQELGKSILGFSDEVTESFMTYQWPGNLRELNNVIKRASLLTPGTHIEAKSLPQEIVNNIRLSFSENSSLSNRLNSGPNLKSAALEAEYETIINVLKQVNFNKTKAAQILNIDRKTLYNKMKAFNL